MAQNLHPWFREYLIDLLQNHTQDFNDAPVHGKKKKVQITKVCQNYHCTKPANSDALD